MGAEETTAWLPTRATFWSVVLKIFSRKSHTFRLKVTLQKAAREREIERITARTSQIQRAGPPPLVLGRCPSSSISLRWPSYKTDAPISAHGGHYCGNVSWRYSMRADKPEAVQKSKAETLLPISLPSIPSRHPDSPKLFASELTRSPYNARRARLLCSSISR